MANTLDYKRYLSPDEAAQITARLAGPVFEPDQQVLWSGIYREVAQKWADDRNMQTLTTVLGPLLDPVDPLCLTTGKAPAARSTFMKGASILFAQRIARGRSVVVLCMPPPVKLHPSGLTNLQERELPIVMGIGGAALGSGETLPAVGEIVMCHPMVAGAEDFLYQAWPVDRTGEWTKNFGRVPFTRLPWRAVRSVKMVSLEGKPRETADPLVMSLSQTLGTPRHSPVSLPVESPVEEDVQSLESGPSLWSAVASLSIMSTLSTILGAYFKVVTGIVVMIFHALLGFLLGVLDRTSDRALLRTYVTDAAVLKMEGNLGAIVKDNVMSQKRSSLLTSNASGTSDAKKLDGWEEELNRLRENEAAVENKSRKAEKDLAIAEEKTAQAAKRMSEACARMRQADEKLQQARARMREVDEKMQQASSKLKEANKRMTTTMQKENQVANLAQSAGLKTNAGTSKQCSTITTITKTAAEATQGPSKPPPANTKKQIPAAQPSPACRAEGSSKRKNRAKKKQKNGGEIQGKGKGRAK